MAHKELLRRLAVIRDLGGNPESAVAWAVTDGELTDEIGVKLLNDLKAVPKSRRRR